MGQSIFINFDSDDLTSARARSATDLRRQDFAQFVAGDSLELDLFLVGNSGLLDIQSYSEVRVGIGNLDARPTSGSYTIASTNTLAYNHNAAELEAIVDSAVAASTVTELSSFVFKVQFDDVGAQTIPAIDDSLLVPNSTVSVTKLVIGDATTKETWLWRIFQNPAAFTDTFANISGSGVQGTLSLATAAIYDLLGTNTDVKTFFEVELTDSSGNVQTVLQADVKLNGEVIGHNFAGIVPTSPSIPSSATTFLEGFPDPTFEGDVTFNGSISGLDTADIDGLSAALALKANKANPTFTGNATAPKLTTSEIQAVAGEAIEYDSKEHRFRDEDEEPNNLVVIKKDVGIPIGKVGINQNNPKVALHVVGGHTSAGGIDDEALRVVGSGLFTSDNDTALVVAMDTDNTASTSDAILKLKRDERASETGNVEEMNFGFVGSDFIYTNSTANAAYLEIEKGRPFEIAVRNTSGVLIPFRMLKVDNVGVDVSGTMKVGHFTTTERNALSAENGMIIYNSSEDTFQGYADGAWTDLSG